jgi:hypothetical protein
VDDDRHYTTIRDPDLLGPLIGTRVVDVTQHDKDEYEEDGRSYFSLHFDNGTTLTIFLGDEGFVIDRVE